jgi:hypothetical protein
MPAVDVKNTGKSVFAADLYHALYCEISRDCKCKAREVLRPVQLATGEVKTQYDRVVSPRAIYLAPGQTIRLHPAVQRLPLVKKAIRERRIEVKTVQAATKPAPTPAPKPAVEAPAPEAPAPAVEPPKSRKKSGQKAQR